jgi:ribonuclease HIII
MHPRIGVDESGKGDYFGYLVVAGVFVDPTTEKLLKGMNVRDSKKISDNVAIELAKQIKKVCPHEIVKISPEKYNVLHKKFRNLNKLLAWAHSRVIENMLERTKPKYVIIDKFADEKFLDEALLEKGKKITVVQRTKAESDMAVAAASVIARAEFLQTLRKLSLELGYKLPKGATHVNEAIKHIMKNYENGVLNQVAKTHFKNSKRVIKEINNDETKL